MTSVSLNKSIEMKRILYLTDFSPPSEHALPFAAELARRYGGCVEILHVLTPEIPESCPNAVQADEKLAAVEIKIIESKIVGTPFTSVIMHGTSVWEAVEDVIRDHHIDLIVAGTHGRTGVSKLLLGSVAEEVFRRSPVPVLTVGPEVGPASGDRAQLKCVLFAADFGVECENAACWAASLAEENHARLILMHVMRDSEPTQPSEIEKYESRVANTIDQLRQIAPSDPAMRNPAEVAVEHGDAAERILAAAEKRKAGLIVMGVHSAAKHLGAATHFDMAVAHNVVARASCPVLTVRGPGNGYQKGCSYDIRREAPSKAPTCESGV